MELAKSLAIQFPMIIASLVFVTAAILKVGKEKGATLVMCGAFGLCLLTFANPIIYSGIMPRVIESGGMENVGRIYMAVGLLTGICWAASIVLVAVGTFLRPPAGR